MRARTVGILVVMLAMLPGTARGQQYADRGAIVGGVGGALAGAAIGKNNGDSGKGALIGGALGLVTGSLIGDSMDQQRTQSYVIQQQLQQQQVQRLNRCVSTYDVVNMTRSGVGDQVIISHIQANGVQRRLEVNDIIALHQQGVSQPVINAMQNASTQTIAAIPMAAPPQPATVIVRERYVAPPSYYYHHPHYYHARRPPPPGVHWGITIGH